MGSWGAGASGSSSKSWQQGSGCPLPRLQSVQHLASLGLDFNCSSKRQRRTGEADAGIIIPTQNSNNTANIFRIRRTVTPMGGLDQDIIPPFRRRYQSLKSVKT